MIYWGAICHTFYQALWGLHEWCEKNKINQIFSKLSAQTWLCTVWEKIYLTFYLSFIFLPVHNFCEHTIKMSHLIFYGNYSVSSRPYIFIQYTAKYSIPIKQYSNVEIPKNNSRKSIVWNRPYLVTWFTKIYSIQVIKALSSIFHDFMRKQWFCCFLFCVALLLCSLTSIWCKGSLPKRKTVKKADNVRTG